MSIDLEWLTRRFDPIDQARLQDPYPLYRELRERCPVAHSDAHMGGFWVLSRYEDVRRVALDAETFASGPGIAIPPLGNPLPMIPLEVDPPDHEPLRRLVSPAFAPARMRPVEASARSCARQLVDAFAARGECDLVTELAYRLPVLTIWQRPLLGEPLTEGLGDWVATFQSWVHDFKHSQGRSAEAGATILAYVERVLDARRAEPADDIPSTLLNAEVAGRPLTREEQLGYLFILFTAGVETTAAALGSIFLFLAREPEVRARLAAEPELLDPAIEELLRFLGPVQAERRTATRDVEVGGCPIRAGESVLLLWNSAGRDEAEFADGETFVPDRFPNRHLSFGLGPHRCVGSHLARLTLRAAIQEVLERLPDYRVRDGAELRFSVGTNRSLVSLPVVFTPE